LCGHQKLNPSFPPFTLRARGPLGPAAKGRNYPSLAKRGEGRFSEEYVFSIMDSLVIIWKLEFGYWDLMD